MSKVGRDPETLLPLTPAVFHILLALADGEKHGYAIMQEVGLRTDGTFRMGPGTLYESIKRMQADGLIMESGEYPDPTTGLLASRPPGPSTASTPTWERSQAFLKS